MSENDREKGGKADRKADRFADLIGETKPLAQGPARARHGAGDPKSPPKKTTTEARGSAFRQPDLDQPLLQAAPGVSDTQLFALSRAEPPPEERIDLHGLRRKAANRVIVDRITSARARGLRCVIVIHGRGERSGSGVAVLRDALPAWLAGHACAKHVLAFAPAPNQLGGEGATLVLLRKADESP